MNKLAVTLIFLCSLFLVACGLEKTDASNEKVEKEETNSSSSVQSETDKTEETSTSEPKKDAVKELDTKSSEIFDWFEKSGLVRGEKDDVDPNESAGMYAEFKSKGVISTTFARVEDKYTMQITEFQTEDEAFIYAEENAYAETGFLHENIYVALKVNIGQIDNYIKILEAGKPIENLDRIIYSEEQRQIHEALKKNDLEQATTVYSSIEDWETKDKIFDDELYMTPIEFDTVYIGPYYYEDYIFGITPDIYSEPYEDYNFELDGHYVFVNADYFDKELELGKKYAIEGYIDNAGTFQKEEADDNGGVWSVMLTSFK